MLILGTEILRLTSAGNQEGETSVRFSSVRLLYIRSGLSLQPSDTLQEFILLVHQYYIRRLCFEGTNADRHQG